MNKMVCEYAYRCDINLGKGFPIPILSGDYNRKVCQDNDFAESHCPFYKGLEAKASCGETHFVGADGKLYNPHRKSDLEQLEKVGLMSERGVKDGLEEKAKEDAEILGQMR